MADVSHRGGLAGHPDVSEMRDRYSRVLGGRDVALVDGPVFLAGLYCAISPWVVASVGAQPNLLMNNLVVGIAIGLLALGFTMVPERMYGLSWAICAIGAWMVAAPWLAGTDPGAVIIWNNLAIGAVVFLLGLVCAQQVMKNRNTEKS